MIFNHALCTFPNENPIGTTHDFVENTIEKIEIILLSDILADNINKSTNKVTIFLFFPFFSRALLGTVHSCSLIEIFYIDGRFYVVKFQL